MVVHSFVTSLLQQDRARACTYGLVVPHLNKVAARTSARKERGHASVPFEGSNGPAVGTTSAADPELQICQIYDRVVNLCRDFHCQYSRLSAHHETLTGHRLPES